MQNRSNNNNDDCPRNQVDGQSDNTIRSTASSTAPSLIQEENKVQAFYNIFKQLTEAESSTTPSDLETISTDSLSARQIKGLNLTTSSSGSLGKRGSVGDVALKGTLSTASITSDDSSCVSEALSEDISSTAFITPNAYTGRSEPAKKIKLGETERSKSGSALTESEKVTDAVLPEAERDYVKLYVTDTHEIKLNPITLTDYLSKKPEDMSTRLSFVKDCLNDSIYLHLYKKEDNRFYIYKKLMNTELPLSGTYAFIVVKNQDNTLELRMGGGSHYFLSLVEEQAKAAVFQEMEKEKYSAYKSKSLGVLASVLYKNINFKMLGLAHYEVVAAGSISFSQGKAISFNNESGCYHLNVVVEDILAIIKLFDVFKDVPFIPFVENKSSQHSRNEMESNTSIGNNNATLFSNATNTNTDNVVCVRTDNTINYRQ